MTSIIDFGIQFDMEKLAKKSFKTFSFSKTGHNQLDNECNGIGVGLSTADALVNGLGGDF